MLLLLFLAMASAQDPDEDLFTIVIQDELTVFEAKEALSDQLESQGYYRDVQPDGDVIFRHGQSWQPVVVVTPEGHVRIRRRGLVWHPPGQNWSPNPPPLATLSCFTPWTLVSCISAKGITTGPRRMLGRKSTVAQDIHAQVVDLQDALSASAIDGRVLRDVQRIWVDGTDLDGTPLSTQSERKSAIGRLWSSRAHTEWGRRAQSIIERYVQIVIQSSEHGFSAGEIQHWEQIEGSGRSIATVDSTFDPPSLDPF